MFDIISTRNSADVSHAKTSSVSLGQKAISDIDKSLIKMDTAKMGFKWSVLCINLFVFNNVSLEF